MCEVDGDEREENSTCGILKKKFTDECYILTFDPAEKYYSELIHRKEVTHSNGQ